MCALHFPIISIFICWLFRLLILLLLPLYLLQSLLISFRFLRGGSLAGLLYFPIFVANVSANELFGLPEGPTTMTCPTCTIYNASSR